MRIHRLALPLALAVAACGEPVLDVDLKLVTQSCDSTRDPLTGVSELKFSIYGEGIAPLTTRARLSEGSLTVPGIPAGKGRRIIVEGLAANTDRVIARGETGPLELVGTDRVPVTVFIRATNGFVPPNTEKAPSVCTRLQYPRAGHTATLMNDGRVLIAGGYYENPPGSRFYLKSTEIYDPRTGEVSVGPELSVDRAFHTATHIPGTPFTVIAGGENRVDGGALPIADVYDESAGTFLRPKVMLEPRSRHAAAVPPRGGRLLIAGGFNANGVPLASTEVFDTQTMEFEAGPVLDKGRAELSAIGLGSGQILLAGGWDGTSLPAKTYLLTARGADASGAYEIAQNFGVNLGAGRAWPMLAAIDDTRVVVTGGFTTHPGGGAYADIGSSTATRSTEVVDVDKRQVVAATNATLANPSVHGGIVPLLNGQLLLAGGGFRDTVSGNRSLGDTSILTEDSGESAPLKLTALGDGFKLGSARYLARYTMLGDGTVLASGGVSYQGSAVEYLASLEIFQPGYQASMAGPY